MASLGWFEAEVQPSAWFCAEVNPTGWFDVDVISTSTGNQMRRALYWNGSAICEITDVLIGTGKKPIVLLNGRLQERAASEGVPVIALNGRLRCLDSSTESLMI